MQFNNSVQFKLPRFIVFEKNDCDRRTGIQMSDLKMGSVLVYRTPKNKNKKLLYEWLFANGETTISHSQLKVSLIKILM